MSAKTEQCSICACPPPYSNCAGTNADGGCARIAELEAKLAAASAECDRYYGHLAGLFWSGRIDNLTGDDMQKMADECRADKDKLAREPALRAELKSQMDSMQERLNVYEQAARGLPEPHYLRLRSGLSVYFNGPGEPLYEEYVQRRVHDKLRDAAVALKTESADWQTKFNQISVVAMHNKTLADREHERAEKAEGEIRAFHMNYRLQCDAETKRLEVALAALKAENELLQFSWSGCAQQLRDAIEDLKATEAALAEERKDRFTEKVRMLAGFEEQYALLDADLRPKLKDANTELNRLNRKFAAARQEAAEFRDSILNQRGALAENGMTNDQVNDVLSEFDTIIRALTDEPRWTQDMLDQVDKDAAMIASKMKVPKMADEQNAAGRVDSRDDVSGPESGTADSKESAPAAPINDPRSLPTSSAWEGPYVQPSVSGSMSDAADRRERGEIDHFIRCLTVDTATGNVGIGSVTRSIRPRRFGEKDRRKP